MKWSERSERHAAVMRDRSSRIAAPLTDRQLALRSYHKNLERSRLMERVKKERARVKREAEMKLARQ